jgi:hypothetical protein
MGSVLNLFPILSGVTAIRYMQEGKHFLSGRTGFALSTSGCHWSAEIPPSRCRRLAAAAPRPASASPCALLPVLRLARISKRMTVAAAKGVTWEVELRDAPAALGRWAHEIHVGAAERGWAIRQRDPLLNDDAVREMPAILRQRCGIAMRACRMLLAPGRPRGSPSSSISAGAPAFPNCRRTNITRCCKAPRTRTKASSASRKRRRSVIASSTSPHVRNLMRSQSEVDNVG